MRLPSVRVLAAATLTLGLGVAGTVQLSAQTAPAAMLTSVATLQPIRLAAAMNAARPETIANDRGINLGGLGSGLWRTPADPAGVYWTITDRGPNGLIPVDGTNRRTFPAPDFSPAIVKVQAQGQTLTVLETLILTGTSGRPITGLPNLVGADEVPYAYDAQGLLTYNQSGLDTEDLVRTPNGDFWTVDEYSTSLVRIDSTGKVLKRYVPVGVKLPTADYPVVEALPAIFARRTPNRGFEGLAITPDSKTLVLALQSPLRHPTTPIGNASRNTRFLTFDIATEKITGEYLYQFQPHTEFGAAPTAAEMKVSALAAIDSTIILVDERTDPIAKIYRVDLSKATNILGTRWDDPATTPALEALNEASPGGIVALPKFLVADLGTLPNIPGKIEGLVILSPTSIAIMNDNDFSFSEKWDAQGNFTDPGVRIQLLTISIPGGFTGVPAPFLVAPAAAPAPAPAKTGNAGPLPAGSTVPVVAFAILAVAAVFGSRRLARR